MTIIDYSADDAGTYVHSVLTPELQQKYSITLVQQIIEGINEYLDLDSDDDEPDMQAMLSHIVNDFGAMDDSGVELTIADLEVIYEAEEDYIDLLMDEDDEEEDE